MSTTITRVNTRTRTRSNGETSSPAPALAVVVAITTAAFAITGTPLALAALVVAAALAAYALRDWSSVVLFPAASALLLWTLLIPAIVTGESLSALTGWALVATLLTCPAPALAAALGTVVAKYAPRAVEAHRPR